MFTGNHAIFGDENAGRIELYESGTLTLSPGVYDFFLVGGGASGKYGSGGGATGSGGGGGGYTKTHKGISIRSGHTYAVTIGAGGSESNRQPALANGGSATSISGKELPDEKIAANGGAEETKMSNVAIRGTDGGSGGGGVTYDGRGGSDGSNGYEDGAGQKATGSYGQGSTTRAFGEVDGTLYAGGGGGGGANHTDNSGKGGGGNGQYSDGISAKNGTPGTPNTGGGGGGGAKETSAHRAGLKGGSGLAMIRWNNAV